LGGAAGTGNGLLITFLVQRPRYALL